MLIYLLKFSACLAILLLFYKLALEKVHIHNFKRYYLLSAFLISLSIPLITFTQYVTVTIEPSLIETYIDQTSSNPIENKTNNEPLLPIILWCIYVLGVFIFALKFFGNLRALIKNIKHNPKLKSGRIHHVLLQELIAPHTFFSYIFFNRTNYESQKIPQEVFWHEETHANQKHSLDILLLELLQIVFWFHPLIYWAKHLAKLNHEFLADQAVLNRGASVPNYQNLVLAFSSNAVTSPLANAIHYSSIKKRIVIMKTQTSKRVIWLKSLLLIPLMALLLYSFSTKEVLEVQKIETITIEQDYHQETIIEDIEQEKINDSRNQNIPTQEISIAINKKGQLLVNVDLVNIEDLKSHLLKYNQGLTKEQREKSVRAVISVEKETPANIIKQVDAILMDYGVATIDIKGPTKSPTQVGATKTEIKEFNTLAKKYNAQPQETRVIPLKDLKKLETFYGRMSNEQKQQAQPFPECPPVPPAPDPAPAPKLVPTIKKGEPSPIPPVPTPPKTETKVDHTEALGNNNHISRKVLSKAKMVPVVSSDFPPPPPTIATHVNTENYSKEVKYAINTYLKKAKSYRAAVSRYHNAHMGSINELKKNYVEVMQLYDTYKKLAYKENHYVHPVPLYSDPKGEFGNPDSTPNKEEDNIPAPTLKSSTDQKLKAIKEPSVYYGHLYTAPQPPAQKNPDPVEYIKELAEKGATFYIGPHQYKTDEAIELVRKSKNASIDVSDYPVVRLGGC
ncbi:M56 family metallopeptidase [Arenibacter echinorum]|uniref:Beta-lactamase regulating signal transducer with metallopeptidase domain n=1 Tax=Arenibacter echinorum TaxID=440515 RepID=A0A327R6W9_9FLAO|nr:M56 family metallopeptidase [Arenibacter echinorum]RAJ11333.1 beta-lactamase regulating signal transducer with metallopeptidase domain [Arenibacter echinorum]